MNQVPFSIKYCIHDCHITIGLKLWQYIYSQQILYIRICEWCRPLSSHYARIRSDRKQGDSLVPLSYLGHKKYYFDMPMHLQHPQVEWKSHANFGVFYSFTRQRSLVHKNLFQLFYLYFQSLNNAFQKRSKLHQLFKSLPKTLNFCYFYFYFITIYISLTSPDTHSFLGLFVQLLLQNDRLYNVYS